MVDHMIANRNLLNGIQKRALTKLEDLHKQILKLPLPESTIGTYGSEFNIGSLKEFIAEAFSNDNFVRALGEFSPPTDKDLVAKEVNEDPTQEEPANTDEVPTAPVVDPTYSEPAPGAVKTYTMEDGRVCEIHGDEATGFAIRHGNRSMPSRFKTIDEASLALEMYQARCRARNQSNDYIDEA